MKILNRAKSKYKDYYPIGQWLELGDKCFIIEDKVGFAIEDTMGWFDDGMMDGNIQLQDFIYEVEKNTRALNFEDMLDSQGNKIFSSLSEDGKGGDIMKDDEYYGIAKYKDSSFVVEYENVEECLCEGNFEIVGIQE